MLLRPALSALFLYLSGVPPAQANVPPWALEVAEVSFGGTTLSGITVSAVDTESGGPGIALRVASAAFGDDGAPYGPFELACEGAPAEILGALCRGGGWRLDLPDGWPDARGSLLESEMEGGAFAIRSSGRLADFEWAIAIENRAGAFELSLEIPAQDLRRLAFLEARLPQLAWVSAGSVGGTAQLTSAPDGALQARARLSASGVDFDSPDGLYAGMGVAVSLDGRLGGTPADAATVRAGIESGELLLLHFYRDFSGTPLSFEAEMAFSDSELNVPRLRVGDGDALELAAQARIPLGDEAGSPELLLRELQMSFPQAYHRYLEPMAAIWSLAGLETSGSVRWTGDWSPGSARVGELELDSVAVVDSRQGRFAIRGLTGTLQTGSVSRLSWDSAAFQKIELGAGEVEIGLTPESVSIEQPLRIGAFDGTVALERFSVAFPKAGDTDLQLQARIEDVDMRLLSRALGWPEFEGTLNGRIPGVNWSGGVIDMEGALAFEVFGGNVTVTDLKVERPFGVLPSLAANITAGRLDLEQLTQTFSFGRIAGRIDGYVRNLRMLDWKPVSFDAWFGTAEADGGKHDISRQAVRHLATIGGGSPTAVLSGPVLRLFNNFSYRRLGLGCTLHNNVCHIRGIGDEGEGVMLLAGAGIPNISIRAYNRAVDWPQLLAELSAVAGGDEIQIGK